MDRTTAAAMHKKIADAVAIIGAAHGIKIKTGTFRYDADGFKLSLEGKSLVETTSGSQITAAALSMCKIKGYNPNLPNRNGYVIVDYNPRAHKMPWIVQTATGQRYKLTDFSAGMYFHEKKAAAVTASVESMATDVMKKTGTYDGTF